MDASIHQSTWDLHNMNLMALARPSFSTIPRLSAYSSFFFLNTPLLSLAGHNENLEQIQNILLEVNDVGFIELTSIRNRLKERRSISKSQRREPKPAPG
jgi:hypothetical protein